MKQGTENLHAVGFARSAGAHDQNVAWGKSSMKISRLTNNESSAKQKFL